MPFVRGETENLFSNIGLLINIPQEQINFKIEKLEYKMRERNVDHTFYLSLLKFVFAVVSGFAAYIYWKTVIRIRLIF